MKAKFCAILALTLMCLFFLGCTRKFEVRCVPVEVAYVAAYNTPAYHHKAKWFVKYERTYSNGETTEKWRRVQEDTYRAALVSLRE